MWPHERSLVKNLRDKPFALIGVNESFEPMKLQEVMDKEKLTWRSFSDGAISLGEEVWGKWNVDATPTLYIIDHTGVIRHKWVGDPGEKAIDRALEKLIKEAEREE
jgi:peroxiredoxin